MLQISAIGSSERQVSVARVRDPLVPLRLAARCLRGAGFGFSTTAAIVASTTVVFVAEGFGPDFLVDGEAAFDDLGVDFRVDFFVDALTRFGDSTADSTVAVADAFVVIGPLLDLR
ncbi:MAG: hypothetical protein GY921_07320 [Phycisphaeraceae bacterium]|nr:hypothetical protein [Planctomycetaceae bacterium]MCP4938978.1 hypothetical protein [Phycisphaeraceae bacterium]HAC09296.1 hypothetical protein [Phycisphaerales bacterium]